MLPHLMTSQRQNLLYHIPYCALVYHFCQPALLVAIFFDFLPQQYESESTEGSRYYQKGSGSALERILTICYWKMKSIRYRYNKYQKYAFRYNRVLNRNRLFRSVRDQSGNGSGFCLVSFSGHVLVWPRMRPCCLCCGLDACRELCRLAPMWCAVHFCFPGVIKQTKYNNNKL